MSTLKDHGLTTTSVVSSTLESAINPLKSPIIKAIEDTSDVKKNLHQADPTSPTTALHDQLARHTKLAQVHVAQSLIHSSDIDQGQHALSMMSCGRYASTTGQFIRPLNRCHRRSCPLCSSIKGRQIARRTARAVEQLRFTLLDEAHETHPANRLMVAIKVTLNSGEACTFGQLRTRLSALHKIWARLLRLTDISEHLIGSLRASEITQSSLDKANPHIHGLLLMRASTNLEEVSAIIRRYWPKAIRREVIKVEKNRAHSAVKSVGSIEYTDTQTLHDVEGWIQYVTKGSYDFTKEKHRKEHSLTTRNYWIAADAAIKGMRMISFSGDLKEAVSTVKEHEKDERAQLGHTHSHDATPSHVWSDRLNRYIDINDAQPNDVNYAILSQSISHTEEPPPLFGFIAQAEIQNQLNADRKAKAEKLRQRLLSLGDTEAISQFYELFTININKDTEDDGHDDGGGYHEPHEVERSSLVKRRQARLIRNELGANESPSDAAHSEAERTEDNTSSEGGEA